VAFWLYKFIDHSVIPGLGYRTLNRWSLNGDSTITIMKKMKYNKHKAANFYFYVSFEFKK